MTTSQVRPDGREDRPLYTTDRHTNGVLWMIYDAALLMGHTGVKKNLRQRQAKSPTPTGWVAGGGLETSPKSFACQKA